MKKIRYGRMIAALLVTMVVIFMLLQDAAAFTLNVQEPNGTSVSGYRWLVEEDTTNHTIPGALVSDSISVDIHKSYAPVVAKGHTDSNSASITVPGGVRYFVSVLPDNGYSISGTSVDINQSAATVIVNQLPLPTAQIWILAFNDNFSINNAPDLPNEAGLEGFTVTISDIFGQQMMDAFGNPLGTTYQQDVNGEFILDAEGAPVMDMMGTGVITTNANGEANIKYLAPGKYGVQVIPPAGSNWVQTATIEGTKVIDAWVKANEPKVFIEGFGAGTYHVTFGYVNAAQLPWAVSPPAGTGTITGRLLYNHFAKPPFLQGFWPGEPVGGGWVGLNDPATGQGLYAVSCDANSNFTINNVPPGTYELVTWDENLISLFGFNTVIVPADANGNGTAVNLGNVLNFRWFGKLEGSVFYDTDQDGFRDPTEQGISGQNVNLRFRDGTIYQAQPTDLSGEYAFEEVFPFFKWLVVEVDFARFKDTGMTAIVDDGGQIQPDNGWVMPSRDKLNPQVQIDMDPLSPTFGLPIINPNTGNALSRTQVSTTPGEVLLQAMQLTLNQTNVIDWGKINYAPGKNGGISGIVYYDTTRAENDPRYCVGEPWCPGIPRVQVNLYRDSNRNRIIDDLNSDGVVTLADVDNYPFGWRDDPNLFETGVDIDRNGNGIFNAGDAIQIVTTDSWDDSMPTGSIQTVPVVHGQPVKAGFDNFATWNQIRPGVFDGGYAIGSYFPGGIESGSAEVDGLPTGIYIVEAITPPGYELVKEEDKNVDFGDSYVPSKLLLPPVVVGDPHFVPAELSLFPGVPCEFAGQTRPLCDRKQVVVSPGKNAASDFFFFTEVPKAARCVGFTLNDLSAEFDTTSPIFHEKAAPSWLPISFQDWAGNELCRVYTDEWGGFNALLPSTYSINVPAPSGVSPQMITAVINDPGPIPDPQNPGQMMIDPFYNEDYAITPWTLQYLPGSTTYLDTPTVPTAAFVGLPITQIDIEPADGTPVIVSVEGPDGGPVICNNGQQLIIKSAGSREVRNPEYDPTNPVTTATVIRDFGFGNSGTVTIGTTPATVNSWANDTVVVTVDTNIVSTGTLKVARNDTMLTSPLGVTVYIGDCANVIHVSQGQSIQDAIDGAQAGDIIAVGPGFYDENVILYKNVTLLGSGADGTTIIGNPRPAEQLVAWHAKIVQLLGTAPFAANEAPVIMVLGNAGYTFAQGSSGVISNFTLTGSISGGGIYVNSFADYLEISNNKVKGNQGELGGGIVIGTPGLTDKSVNVYIHDNQVVKNSGVVGGGGIVVYAGADDYLIKNNLIMGNLTRRSGGGIDHSGLSDGGRIIGNKILNNEAYYGLLAPGGGDGGGIFVGSETAATDGA
ncbi:MAG: SdrD B-like domain-containing protein, partial [Phycisphaerae bacterium]